MPPFEDEEQQVDAVQAAPSIRDTLTANFDAAEAGTLGQTADADQPEASTAPVDGRARDENGRFAAKAEEKPTDQQSAAPADQAKPSLTTWRREMRPLHEKLAAGVPLTPEEAKSLAAYNVQREQEYSTGISTYKSEAQQAKAVRDVLVEFMPALQHAGLAPEKWIQDMGRTHAALVFGSPEQKLNVLAQAMQGYGISPQAFIGFLQGQPDQNAMAQMHQAHAGAQYQQQLAQAQYNAQQAQQQLQQYQQSEMQQQLAKFADTSKYPHFEQVREEMARLLDAGSAHDLDSAYAKAVRINDEAWEAEQQRQAAEAAAKDKAMKAAAAAKARQAGGSISGGSAVTAPAAKPTDIRSALGAAWDEHASAGRV